MSVTTEDFVRTWQTSESAKEVGEKLGMKYSYVCIRISKLRRLGLKVKDFKRDKKKINIGELQKLADSLAKAEVANGQANPI